MLDIDKEIAHYMQYGYKPGLYVIKNTRKNVLIKNEEPSKIISVHIDKYNCHLILEGHDGHFHPDGVNFVGTLQECHNIINEYKAYLKDKAEYDLKMKQRHDNIKSKLIGFGKHGRLY